jgi:prefoldin alpha subunit
MAADTPEFIDSALVVYHAEVRKAITAQQNRLEQLQVAHDNLQGTIKCVKRLPSKLRHQIMVPYGKHAFFPGYLTRTNELTVHLGDQYYVETTASTAQGILQRKLAVLAQGITKGQQQLQSLQARLDVTNRSLKDESGSEPAFEIRSSVEESDALLASVKRLSAARGAAAAKQQQSAAAQAAAQAADDAANKALQSRLEELIKLEAQMEAEEELQQWTGQQELQGGLTPIAEGEEGSGTRQPEASSLTSPPAVTSIASKVHQLQLLEAEPDSDDEQQQLQHQQQHMHRSVPSAGTSSQQVGSATSAAAAAHTGRKIENLKPALKKGFFNSPSAASVAHGRPSVSSSARLSKPSNTPPVEAGGSSSSSGAFTGMVVERSAAEQPPDAPGSASGRLLRDAHERQPIPAASRAPVPSTPSTGQASSTSVTGTNTRPSKFKLQRMAL